MSITDIALQHGKEETFPLNGRITNDLIFLLQKKVVSLASDYSYFNDNNGFRYKELLAVINFELKDISFYVYRDNIVELKTSYMWEAILKYNGLR